MLARLRSLVIDSPLLAIIVFIVVGLLPLFGLSGYWQRQVIMIAIFTLLCSGLNLSFGYAGELALGQVAVYAFGAYVGGILHSNGYTDILLAFVLAAAVAGVAGLISGIPGLRLSHWSLALVSFFFVLLVPSLISIFDEHTGGSLGLPGIIGPTLLGTELTPQGFYVTALVVTAVWMLVLRNLVVSRFGSYLRVLHEGATLAETLGGSVYRLRLQAYAIGALPAGLAGVLHAYLTGFISPEAFTLTVLIAILAATVVGGSESVWGAPVGATLLVLGPLQAASFEKYSTAVYGVFLVIVGALFAGGLAAIFRSLRERVLPQPSTYSGPGTGREEDSLTVPGQRLQVADVRKSFAGLTALDGVDLVVEPGTITAVIGANGAGKTTLVNVISGVIRADDGTVELAGRSITGLRPYQVSRLGVGRTFQTPMVPTGMTALEVVESGRLHRGKVGFASAILRPRAFYQRRAEDRHAAMAALSFAGLEHLADHKAGSLPLGTRRLLEVVRAVAGEPNVLLLDEPAAGLDDEGLQELRTLMRRTRDAGGTVVLIEHNVPFVMGVADSVHVMAMGKVIASGPPDVVRTDQRVIDSYLGRRGARESSTGTTTDVESGAK